MRESGRVLKSEFFSTLPPDTRGAEGLGQESTTADTQDGIHQTSRIDAWV